jgi:hypothetical protein
VSKRAWLLDVTHSHRGGKHAADNHLTESKTLSTFVVSVAHVKWWYTLRSALRFFPMNILRMKSFADSTSPTGPYKKKKKKKKVKSCQCQ